MAGGYTFLGEAVSAENVKLVNAAIVASGIGIVGLIARTSLQKASDPLVPDDKLSARSVFDLIASFLISLGDGSMGKENRRYLPFVAVLFTYLFLMNVLALIPGVVLSTDHFAFNFGIALVVFGLYNIWGVRELGIVNYIKHFCGPVVLIAPVIFCIELVSHAIRPMTLGLRLFGNMTGDHALLGVFNGLVPFSALPFYFLGTLVSFIQAFIFTLLTMVYIGMAVSHDH